MGAPAITKSELVSFTNNLRQSTALAKPLVIALALIMGTEVACTSCPWCHDHWQVIVGGTAACIGGMTLVLSPPKIRNRALATLIISLACVYFCFGVVGHGTTRDFSVPNEWIAQNWRPIAAIGLCFTASLFVTKIALVYGALSDKNSSAHK